MEDLTLLIPLIAAAAVGLGVWGFIALTSDPDRKEKKKLGTPEHREALARAIYTGLAEYKRRYDQRMRTAQTAPSRPAPSLPPR